MSAVFPGSKFQKALDAYFQCLGCKNLSGGNFRFDYGTTTLNRKKLQLNIIVQFCSIVVQSGQDDTTLGFQLSLRRLMRCFNSMTKISVVLVS